MVKKGFFWTLLIAACTGIEYLNRLMYGATLKSTEVMVILIGVEAVILMPLANRLYKRMTGESLW